MPPVYLTGGPLPILTYTDTDSIDQFIRGTITKSGNLMSNPFAEKLPFGVSGLQSVKDSRFSRAMSANQREEHKPLKIDPV